MRRLVVGLLVLTVLVGAGLVQPVAAITLFGVRGHYGLGEPADLITIDQTTGALDSVKGLTGMTGVGGFAVNPLDGTLYAVGGGDGTPGLHTLDPTTGAATFVGGGVTASDMGFDRTGTLYAVMADDGTGIWGELVTIDLSTGGITSIGGSFIGGIGVAFDSANTLFIKVQDTLHTVDPTTGGVLTTVTLDSFLRNSLAIDENDVLYSHDWGSGGQIYTIDPLTGTTTALPSTVPPLDGDILLSAMDFTGVIPEPSTLAIWGVLTLCGIGIGWRRRRKA
jgi:putative pyrroloquinoline-quinone binding quinoprotein